MVLTNYGGSNNSFLLERRLYRVNNRLRATRGLNLTATFSGCLDCHALRNEKYIHIHIHIYGMNRSTDHWQAFFIWHLSNLFILKKVQTYYECRTQAVAVYLSRLIFVRFVSEYMSSFAFSSKSFSHHDIIVLMLLCNPNMYE